MLFKKEIVLQYKHSKSMNVQKGEFTIRKTLFDLVTMWQFLKISASGIGVEKENKEQFWVWPVISAECIKLARSSWLYIFCIQDLHGSFKLCTSNMYLYMEFSMAPCHILDVLQPAVYTGEL